MEAFTDHEKLLLCPYNNAHEIFVARMKEHLTRCRKNHPDTTKTRCPYNTTHIVPEPEMQYHVEYCEDRRPIEQQVYTEEGTDTNSFPIINKEVSTDESWDNFNVPSYDSKKVCESKDIIRHCQVESAAKRRNFRYEERRRLSELADQKKGHVKQSVPPNTLTGKLPYRATGTILLENDPDPVLAVHELIKCPPIPIIPGKSKSKD